MFGFLKKNRNPKNAALVFLEKVDEVYQLAFAKKSPQLLIKYMTKGCLTRVAERIRLNDSSNQGISRYRHVKWSLVSEESGKAKWHREVYYDDIKMSYGIVVPVGDSSNELWELQQTDNSRLVSDIRGGTTND